MPAARHASRSPGRAWAVIAAMRGPAATELGANPARRLDPVQLRHLDVHQDEVVDVLPDGVDGLGPVRGDVGGVAEAFQHQERELAVRRVVLGEEDPEREAGSHRPVELRPDRRLPPGHRPASAEERGDDLVERGRLHGPGDAGRESLVLLVRSSAPRGHEEDDGKRRGAGRPGASRRPRGRPRREGPGRRSRGRSARRLWPSRPLRRATEQAVTEKPQRVRRRSRSDRLVAPGLHDERAASGERGPSRRDEGRRGRARGLQPRDEPEGRALSGLALERDGPSHQLGEPARDREAEARAAEATGRRAVALPERLEERGGPIGRDADPRVADGDVEVDGSPGRDASLGARARPRRPPRRRR